MSNDLKKGGKFNRSIKNIMINPAYQMRYIGWLTGTGLTLVLMNSLTFYLFTKENYSLLVDLGPMTDEAKQQLYSELGQIIMYLVLGSTIFLILVTLVGLIFSHRTAGPLYHFKRVFSEIKNGNPKARVRLRPTDDFQEVADTFNEMMDVLEKSQIPKS